MLLTFLMTAKCGKNRRCRDCGAAIHSGLVFQTDEITIVLVVIRGA
jgi:hypothetical protein